MNLKIVNAIDGSEITTESDGTDSVGDLILFATQYWNHGGSAFVMKSGNRLIPSNVSVSEAGLKDGDSVVLVPDPQGG